MSRLIVAADSKIGKLAVLWTESFPSAVESLGKSFWDFSKLSRGAAVISAQVRAAGSHTLGLTGKAKGGEVATL